MRIFVLIPVLLLCAGCLRTEPMQASYSTRSGKPEVFLEGKDIPAAKAALSDAFLSIGFTVTSETPSQITFDRPDDSTSAMMLYGSRWNSVPNARVVFSMVPTPEGVRVVASATMITNPGTAFERPAPMDQATLNTLDAGLQRIAAGRPKNILKDYQAEIDAESAARSNSPTHP